MSASVFTASGHEIALPAFNLVPFESRIVELGPLLSVAGAGGEDLGYIKLNYTGIFLGLGAQLTLYPTENGNGFDSPRSLSSDFKSASRHAAFWMFADSEATFALSNTSTSPITVHLKCGHIQQELIVGGHATNIQRFTTNELVLGDAAIGRHISDGMAASCDLSETGDVRSLRAVGHVTRHAYSAPIRFYDTATSTSQNLTAPDLQTDAETHVALHNVMNIPVLATPILREATLGEGRIVQLPPQTIPPDGTIELVIDTALQRLRQQGVTDATLTVATLSSKGSLVASVTQVADGLTEDIPLRTANPPRVAAGAYPLRWEQDYTNRVSVTNTATKTLKARALITAGSITYTLPIETIPPGETKIYDVDTLRTNRVKDVNGYLLPLDAVYGKFMWADTSMGVEFGLMGRNSVTSKQNHRKSSFSCGYPCETTSDVYPVFLDESPIQYVPYGTNYGSRIVELVDTGGAGYQYPYPFNNTGLTSSISSITQFAAAPSVATSYAASTSNYGTTYISYLYSTDYPYNDEFDDCVDPGPSTGTTRGGGGVLTPTSNQLNYVIYSMPSSSCPSGQAGWDKKYSRFIADQTNNLVGEPQLFQENVITINNGLNFTIQQANYSSPNGFYEDTLQFCSALCPSSKTTTATQNSTSTLNGVTFTLRPSAFVYACTGNTINGQ